MIADESEGTGRGRGSNFVSDQDKPTGRGFARSLISSALSLSFCPSPINQLSNVRTFDSLGPRLPLGVERPGIVGHSRRVPR